MVAAKDSLLNGTDKRVCLVSFISPENALVSVFTGSFFSKVHMAV